jgi:hypothetical protein
VETLLINGGLSENGIDRSLEQDFCDSAITTKASQNKARKRPGKATASHV